MITLRLDERWISIIGANRSAIRRLESVTSYKVAGHFFAPSFRAGYWDGKEHLLNFSKNDGYRAPCGLATDIARTLRRSGVEYKVEFAYAPLPARQQLVWNADIQMRGYQDEAIEALMGPPTPGCGILKLPIRSGKTKLAAKLISKIGLPTLFVVPSKSLLYQTIGSLSECLPNEPIGIIGDSEFDEQFVTVASIQTLARWRGGKGKPRDSRYTEMLNKYPLLIVDEVHHFKGSGDWHKIPHDFLGRFKVGLSATAYMDIRSEQERGAIWMKAACGPIRFDVPMSRLIADGFLMKQHVKMFQITKPDLNGMKWSATMRQRAIVENKARNGLIASCAKRYVDDGRRVAIIARLHEHIRNICDAMDDIGLEYRTIVGSDDQTTRQDVVDGLVRGDYGVIIGTVIGEGVDIPPIEVVINAEGGKDIKSTIQRQRNLTISEGKKQAVLIDFFDQTNQHLQRHSRSRLRVYKSEPMFDVELIDWKP